VSRDALIAAGETMQAFDPTPMPDSLAMCLKPYEQLVPGCHLESEIREAVAKYGRIGVVGGIGCGKSGVSRYALGAAGLGMIALNVVTEDREKIATVRGFLEIFVSQLLSRATIAAALSSDVRERLLASAAPTESLPRSEIRTRAELGGALWLLNGGVAREVTRTLGGTESYRSTQDLRQAARDALEAISANDVIPVLLADDTDRLLAVADDAAQADALFRGFFGEVLREIAEQLECGLVLAIHDRYRDREDYAGLTMGRIETKEIPALDEPSQLEKIIDRRGEFVDPPVQCGELLTPAGLDRLTAIHAAGPAGGLRATLSVFHQALGLAISDGSESTDERHITAADAFTSR
jgi:hypothetical protein